jgi:poly(A) polymerase
LYDFVAEKLQSTPPDEIRPEPLVSGDDLINLGHSPGPRFKEILAAVEDAQLEGKIRSRGEAVEFVTREFPVTI